MVLRGEFVLYLARHFKVSLMGVKSRGKVFRGHARANKKKVCQNKALRPPTLKTANTRSEAFFSRRQDGREERGSGVEKVSLIPA